MVIVKILPIVTIFSHQYFLNQRAVIRVWQYIGSIPTSQYFKVQYALVSPRLQYCQYQKINEKSGKRAYTELGSTHTEKKLANVGFSQCSYFVFTQRCFLAFLLNTIFCHWVRRTALQFGYCIINILVYINSVRGAMIHRYIDGA